MAKKRKINYFIPIGIVAGIGLAVFTSSKPFKVYQQEKAKAADMREELDTLQQSNNKLREKDQLMNPVQKEEEARRMGYVRPDEKPLPTKSNPPVDLKPEEVVPKVKKSEVPSAPIDLREDTNYVKAEPE